MTFLMLSFFAVGSLAWTSWTACKLLVHYYQAQCMGVPILVSPIGVNNMFWLVFQDTLAPYISGLPFNLGYWVRYNRHSWIWQFSDRGRIHQEYGPIIAHVTPSEIEVWIADKDLANKVIKGRDRALFDRPREETQKVDFLGPHLITAAGETWRRHRRIVATPFNQRNNRIVWKESLHQGLLLGEHWHKHSPQGVTTVWEDNKRVAMNVMVTAGFGLPRENQKSFSDKQPAFDFHGSISFVVEQFLWVIFIPSTLWFPKYLPPWPESLRMFFKSVRAFKENLEQMVADSKNNAKISLRQTEPSSHGERLQSDNLLTALVHHSEELRANDRASGETRVKNSLTDDEIYSNLFGLAFAGHESTAHTLAYTFFLLAAHPEHQVWVAEEIRTVLDGVTDVENLDMDETFARLVRARALMYETLRLFTPLPNIFRRTLSPQGATIEVGSKTLSIPPRAFMLPSLYTLHVLEEYWGKDSLEWNPRRWVSTNAQGQEEFLQPSPSGTFLAWSEGPRACPGARFSLVEFVGVCTTLLFQFRINVQCLEGEDEQTARGRVKAGLEDSTSIVSLMVRHPDRIPIKLERI